MIVTRSIRLPADVEAVDALDRSFVATTGYELRRRTADGIVTGIDLVGPVETEPRQKRYDMTAREGGLVARRDGVIVGYAHLAYQAWNRRAEIGDFYVTTSARRSGVGAALMAAVIRRARQTPARCLWLETQNVNGAAITFYLRQGFTLCGFDDTLYDPEQHSGEVALFFSLPL